eukprot:6182721-Pleurochrysis_carterae.AAC.1
MPQSHRLIQRPKRPSAARSYENQNGDGDDAGSDVDAEPGTTAAAQHNDSDAEPSIHNSDVDSSDEADSSDERSDDVFDPSPIAPA